MNKVRKIMENVIWPQRGNWRQIQTLTVAFITDTLRLYLIYIRFDNECIYIGVTNAFKFFIKHYSVYFKSIFQDF